jgi:hypothetical protein
MPLKSKRKSSKATAEEDEPLPPPPETQHKPPPQPPLPSQQELAFHTQLAHGSPTKKIKDFSNVRELYQRIADAFGISSTDVIFCTLNTHKIDMSRLLGGQIGLEDFIYAHVKGQTKEITLTKTDSSLGLTITDNGAGHAFIKRIREGSVMSVIQEVKIGDMIESVDGRNMVGARHFEVAKFLKELPQYTTFNVRLIEARAAFQEIGPRSQRGSKGNALSEENQGELEDKVGSGKATLRLKQNGPAVVEEVSNSSWQVKAAEKIDDLLESFMGIRDMELATSMVEVGSNKTSVDDYALAMDTSLGEFEFPDDFLIDCWKAIESSKQGNT